MTTPHDQIASSLLDVLRPVNGELRLLNRLVHPMIGIGTDDAFLIVPDLHLLSSKRQATFGSYGFNHGDLLGRLLQRLAKLRNAWFDDESRDLVTIQIGDFMDLWRELVAGQSTGSIGDDVHADLRDVLYRGVHRGLPCLQAAMLLGNHDTHDGSPLPEIPIQLKAFNRSSSGKPFLFATHGDTFDLLELLAPDFIKAFVVHFAGKVTPSNTYTVGDFGRAAAKINKSLPQLQSAICQPDHVLDLPAGAPRVTPGAELPNRVVTNASPDTKDRRFSDYYAAFTSPDMATLDGSHVSVVAAGHTHHAGMLLCEPKLGKPLLLIDSGAWIENCTYPLAEGGAATEPSAQLAVIHGNDARIYQVRLL